jgi:hypothetical protein
MNGCKPMQTPMEPDLVGTAPLIIQVTRKLQCGTQISKVTWNWHLPPLTQRIQKHLEVLKTMEFTLVQWFSNVLVDRVENKGVDNVHLLTDVMCKFSEG